MTRMLTEAHSYKTAESAETALLKIFEEYNVEYKYVVIAQPDGRFTPAVMPSRDYSQEAINLLSVTNYRFAIMGVA